MSDLSNNQNLLSDLKERLADVASKGTGFQSVLDTVLSHGRCLVGTIHRWDAATQQLHLVCHRGIPEAIMQQVRTVPLGKGMAGLAAQRRECVSVCNLQTNQSGDVRPGAKLTGMEGAIAVPMLVNGELCGVLGVAKPTAHEFSESEKNSLLEIASLIGKRLC
jgi:putative methionine-R-sulfoxide reductase with GAF domain